VVVHALVGAHTMLRYARSQNTAGLLNVAAADAAWSAIRAEPRYGFTTIVTVEPSSDCSPPEGAWAQTMP
jgi:hypothetical protein